MRRKLIMVLIASLLISSFTIVNVFASRADDYDLSSLSTPHANTASVYQSYIGYSAYPHTDDSVSNAHLRLPNDNVLFIASHGNAGLITVNNNGYLTERSGYYPIEYYSSLNQMLLAVYCACHTANNDAG